MANALVSIYNLALSSIGTRGMLSLPTDARREAEICNLWYEPVRDQVLRAAPWSSCRKTAALALYAERDFAVDWTSGDPEPPWQYTYTLPTDFLYPRHLDDFGAFIMGVEEETRVIYTNAEEPILTYTFRQTVPPAWDQDLYMAIVQGLAAHIAMPLMAKAGREVNALEKANMAILRAQVKAANENNVEYESVPDWLTARGVVVGTQPSRFIYQNGPLLQLNNAF
jgi:hypothetical protein